MSAADVIGELVTIGPRPAGSEACSAACEVIARGLRQEGLSVREEEFDFVAWETVSAPQLIVEGLGDTPCEAMLGSVGGEFSGRLEPHGVCTIWGMYAWPSFRVRGSDGSIQAYILARPDGPAIAQPVPEGGAKVPHLVVGSRSGEALERCAAEKAQVRGQVATRHYHTRQRNIRAWRGEDPLLTDTQTLIVTAHYDTVPATPGAYDNGGGVAALLDVARRLARGDLPDSTQLLCTCAEEFLLAGSRAFAARLEREGKLASVAACVNLDGAGRRDLLDVWIGPENLVERIDAVIGDPRTRYFFPPPMSGDHYAFWERGIPSVMLTFNDLEILHLPIDTVDPRKAAAAERLADVASAIIPTLLA